MNVLFIAIDTLRADHLGCHGHWRTTSPHLDALAARGVRFAQHISPHIPTHPGYTTMFTGKDVLTHQIVAQGGKVELSESVRTLPQVLQRRGYFTAAADNLGRWFNRGYGVCEGYGWAHEGTQPMRKAEAVNETALKVLDACDSQDRPWFCFLHYWDPHTPYLPPAPFSRMFYSGDETNPAHTSAREMMQEYPAFMYYFQDWMPGLTDVEFPKAQYDAEIAYVDTALAHVLTKVAQMKGGEDTAIIVTSDHGEELDEHQMWFDHHGLYETNLHVPLIMHHPERLYGGEVRPGLTSHVDVAPTVLDLVGLSDAAEAEKMEGRSLLSEVAGPPSACGGHPATDAGVGAVTDRDCIYLTECAWMKKRGFRTPRHKYIESLHDELHQRPPFELYELQADPGEQHNLADEQPQILADFQARMQAFVSRRLAETGLPDPQSVQDITLTQVGSPPANEKPQE
jgi:arylsulfatase A-like enzyme